MTIIELQNKYLESPEKRTLESFYDSVLKLSFAIVKESFPGKDIKVAFDLATDLSIRLMITKEPIFKTSPSGYINQALKLIFCKKNKGAILLEDKDICGGGVLFDLGSHAVDMIYHLCGEFDEVIGKSQIAYPVRCGTDGKEWHTNADEAFYMIATLKSGAQGTIEVSKIATGANDDFTFEIHGDAGSIRFDLMEPNFLYVYLNERTGGDFGGDRGYTKIECVNRYPYPAGVFPGQKAPVGWLRGHIGSYYSFIDAIKTGKSPSPSFDEGAYVQKILECAYKSDRERTTVIIPGD